MFQALRETRVTVVLTLWFRQTQFAGKLDPKVIGVTVDAKDCQAQVVLQDLKVPPVYQVN